jgi:hypothetical protein
MILISIASIAVLLLALLPTLMFTKNLQLYRPAPTTSELLANAHREAVSILIPARNEAAGIAITLEHLLKSDHPQFEVLVLDDHSEDGTAEIVAAFAQRDSRVRLLQSKPLPEGWNGKQHACWQLAQLASHRWLLFLDADVHVAPNAISRIMAQMLARPVSLLSGFPRQVTGTVSEQLLIPMMHIVLLGYLPIERMRASNDASFSAGCGQLFFANRADYFQCGGHAQIFGSRHDGIKLPKLFRSSGLSTDLFDATDIAACRMYRGYGQVVRGLLKNATEGIANKVLLIPFTILLGGAFVAPLVLLVLSLMGQWPLWLTIVLSLATLLSFVPRVMAAGRFRQAWLGVILHPLSVAWFLSLQWRAWIEGMLGRRVAWRGRM